MMSWSRRFRMRERIRGSLWLVPLLATLLGALLGTLGALLEKYTELPSLWHYSPSTASTVLTAIVGATAALTGFVVTVSVLVVQQATGAFSPRYMRQGASVALDGEDALRRVRPRGHSPTKNE